MIVRRGAKTIADAAHRLDVIRVARVRLDLSRAASEYARQACAYPPANPSPTLYRKISRAGDHFTRVRHQQTQQFEFLIAQVERHAILQRQPLIEVEFKVRAP